MTAVTVAPSHSPISTAAETAARRTFQALLTALSNPGRSVTLPVAPDSTYDSCVQIGATLLDLETSFYTPHAALRTALAATGARIRPPAQAAYLFWPASTAFVGSSLHATLDAIAQAAVGTITDPDQGATLIVACTLGQGWRLQLHGPGIQYRQPLLVDQLPLDFWQVRAAKVHYPLGIDLFLVDGNQIVGLPRTTLIEIE